MLTSTGELRRAIVWMLGAEGDGGEDEQQDQDADFAEHIFGRMWVG